MLSSDEEQDPPPRKKSRKESRKEPGARSIVKVDADRIPVVEAGFPFIHLTVMTDSSRTWLNNRPGIAVLSEDAFDHGLDVLKLDGRNYGPVTILEQDLVRTS